MRLVLYRGKWCATWRDERGTRRVSLRTDDRGIAERRLADLRRAPAGDTVGERVEAYLGELEHRSANAWRARAAWKHLQPAFGHLRPDQVDRAACRAYAARRRRAGRMDGTIHKELSILRTALRWNDKASPAVFDLPAAPPPRDRWLTRDEYARLLDSCEHAHVRLFVVLALGQAGDGTQRKGRATVPMNARVREALLAAHAGRTCDHVIEYAGRRVGNVKRGIRSAMERAGLYVGGDGAHLLRHTAAVWMAEAGVSMAEIAQFLGHDDSRTTERVYARFSPQRLRTAASALE